MHGREVNKMDEKIMTAKIKIKGYKKVMSQIRRIKKELKKLNREMERSAELEKRILYLENYSPSIGSSERIKEWFS